MHEIAASALVTELPLLDLGPAIASAGFAVVDHGAIIRALEPLQVEGRFLPALAKRQAEFLAGRWAARSALASLGVDELPGRNQDGSPRWPAQIVGSITHGAARALCAAARTRDARSLGIDAESLMSPAASDELSPHVCDEGERAVLRSSLAHPVHHAITLAFSAKESLFKCLYPLVGRFMNFSAASVVAATCRAEGTCFGGEVILELSVDWSSELRRGRRFGARFVLAETHVETGVLLLA